MEPDITSKEHKEHAGIEKKKAIKSLHENEKTSVKTSSSVQVKTLSPESKELKASTGKIALILIRGFIRMRKNIMATLYTLRLRRKHACVVIDDTPGNRAAAMKCKDYIAYGEISDEIHRLLIEKRGRKDPDGKLKKFFSLNPPRGGFERKGIKTPFSSGGALGYRGMKMNELIRRMI
jgi:large subunit ribosomal protein L30